MRDLACSSVRPLSKVSGLTPAGHCEAAASKGVFVRRDSSSVRGNALLIVGGNLPWNEQVARY